MNKKTLFYLVNSPVWAIALSFVYIIGFRRLLNAPQGIEYSSLGNTIHFSIVLMSWLFSAFYIFYSYLIPKYWQRGKKLKFLLFASLTVLILEPTFFFITYLIPLHVTSSKMLGFNLQSVTQSWISCSGITLLIGAIAALCRKIYDSIAKNESKKELEHKKLQSELSTLKSKLNPHLLFNSINNIDTLILTNPELASKLLSKLSDLLRYVVYETEEELVSIKMEVCNLKRYIDLETIRLVNPECVTFTSQISNDVFVPPMLFFPFVENGFKHSNLNKEGQKIQIAISEKERELTFECTNTVMEKPQNENKKGVGLTIARRRLELLFPDKHELKISVENNEFTVMLLIDLS